LPSIPSRSSRHFATPFNSSRTRLHSVCAVCHLLLFCSLYRVSNERVRDETQLEKIELIIKQRRLRWLELFLRMDDKRLPRQAIFWGSSGIKRKSGRPQKNWIDTVHRDLKDIGMTCMGRSATNSLLSTEELGIAVWSNVSDTV